MTPSALVNLTALRITSRFDRGAIIIEEETELAITPEDDTTPPAVEGRANVERPTVYPPWSPVVVVVVRGFVVVDEACSGSGEGNRCCCCCCCCDDEDDEFAAYGCPEYEPSEACAVEGLGAPSEDEDALCLVVVVVVAPIDWFAVAGRSCEDGAEWYPPAPVDCVVVVDEEEGGAGILELGGGRVGGET